MLIPYGKTLSSVFRFYEYICPTGKLMETFLICPQSKTYQQANPAHQKLIQPKSDGIVR
jgi:hypothetical protein